MTSRKVALITGITGQFEFSLIEEDVFELKQKIEEVLGD